VYKCLKYGASPPLPLIKWTIAERFGWTLDYIDSISLADLHEFFEIEEGREKARPAAKTNKRKR
jgi:hypothetical protein